MLLSRMGILTKKKNTKTVITKSKIQFYTIALTSAHLPASVHALVLIRVH